MRILRTASVAIHVRASFVVLVLLYTIATGAEALLETYIRGSETQRYK